MNSEYIKADEYCSHVTDGTHDSPKRATEGKYLITSKHIKGREIDYDNAYLISQEDFDKINIRSKVDQWDVIISMIGVYCGFCYIERRAEIDYAVKNVGLFKTGSKEKAEWLYYYLISPEGKAYLNSVKAGSTQPYLSLGELRRMPIPFPDVRIRQEVCKILDGLDSKIAINGRINDNLLQQAQAIFMHKFGDNTSVTSATIADIALNVTDGVHNTVKDDPEGQYLLLSCKNIKGGLLSIGASERKINSETFEKLRRRTKLAKGDILISSVGTVGELLLLNTDPKNYEFQRSVAIVKPNPELVSSAYVYESLVAKKAELINAAHGAVQQCLFISDIAGFPIGIPNPAELRSFDAVVNPMFDTITANEAENLRLETLRDTLLPMLMSGELDVSALDL